MLRIYQIFLKEQRDVEFIFQGVEVPYLPAVNDYGRRVRWINARSISKPQGGLL
jgi:hypothetical protein